MNQFPPNYQPVGEPGKSYLRRLNSGFLQRYFKGEKILDIGAGKGPAMVPNAQIIDLDTRGYDGVHLPFDDNSIDTIASSHCLEHVIDASFTIKEWYRCVKPGGFLVISVPHQYLYERKVFPPSRWNPDHKRFFTPSSLLALIEKSLPVNSYRIRELHDIDNDYDYQVAPENHAVGSYEIELVLEKLPKSSWSDLYYQDLIYRLRENECQKISICGVSTLGDDVARVLINAGFDIELMTNIEGLGIRQIGQHNIPIVTLNQAVAFGCRDFIIASERHFDEIKKQLCALSRSEPVNIYSLKKED